MFLMFLIASEGNTVAYLQILFLEDSALLQNFECSFYLTTRKYCNNVTMFQTGIKQTKQVPLLICPHTDSDSTYLCSLFTHMKVNKDTKVNHKMTAKGKGWARNDGKKLA